MLDLDENIIVNYNNEECLLKDILIKIQPGETIEGVPFEYFNAILNRLQQLRGKGYSFSTDRRYGKWRFILFGQKYFTSF